MLFWWGHRLGSLWNCYGFVIESLLHMNSPFQNIKSYHIKSHLPQFSALLPSAIMICAPHAYWIICNFTASKLVDLKLFIISFCGWIRDCIIIFSHFFKWIHLLLFPQHLMCIGMIPVLQNQLVSIPRQVDYIMGPWLNWSFVPYAYAMLSCAYFQTNFKQLTFCKTEMTGSAWFLFFLFSYIWLQLRALIL